jgi:aromatic-L-amino-acid/L-tryptophan decarboxylase
LEPDERRDMTTEEFRAIGHRLIDWIADYRAGIAERPVMAQSAPAEVKRQLPVSPPDKAQSFDEIIGDLDRIIVPGLSHWQHPSFFGYFPSNAMLASVLGDYVSTGLGVLGVSWQSSPALTELEEVVTDWVRQMVGLSPAWSGVIQDTASTSTLVALLCAREKASNFSSSRRGLQAQSKPLTVYASTQSHSSVEKAALMAGFGRAHLRLIPCDEDFGMWPDALEEAIRRDLACGMTPCAIVSTSGTTTCTAMDPIAAIADVAQHHGAWLHIDAAMAGSAMILPECRWMWEGVERADSLVLNAHKWLGAAFDCSLYYVREPEHLVAVMSSNPSYLQSGADGVVKNLRDWGLPLGRRFRALKLWFLIREQGIAGLQARLRRDLANAKWLTEQVRATPFWRVVAPVRLQTVCVRHEPLGLEGEALDAHTRMWADKVNHSGAAYVTPAILEGRWMIRVSIGAVSTEREHVAALWRVMQQEAERLTGKD